jgi:hypothetical protein
MRNETQMFSLCTNLGRGDACDRENTQIGDTVYDRRMSRIRG